MNLLTLPDETIAAVLKYCYFTHLFQLRKTNTRINDVARRFDLGTKVPVREFQIDQFRNESSILPTCRLGVHLNEDIIQYFNMNFNTDNYYYFIAIGSNTTTYQDILDNCLSKIESVRKLSFQKYPHQINQNFIQHFAKYRKLFRNCVSLTISEVDFICSKPDCHRFFLLFPQLRSLDLSTRRGADIYCNYEHLPLVNLEIWLGPMYQPPRQDVVLEEMNDSFLFEVVRKCKAVKLLIEIYPETRLRVGGLLTLIETLLSEDDFPTNLNWILPYFHLGDLSLDQAMDRIRKFQDCEYTFREIENYYESFTSICFELYFPANQGYVQFHIVTKNE